MKKHVNFLLLILAFFLTLSFSLKAQAPVFKAASASRPAVLWDLVPMNGEGDNLKNGVEFYSKPFECNGQKVDLIKLINKNTYPVKISYQTEKNGPVQFVRIPGSGSVEGSCGTTDPNLSKLILQINAANETEQKEINKFIISSVIVSGLE